MHVAGLRHIGIAHYHMHCADAPPVRQSGGVGSANWFSGGASGADGTYGRSTCGAKRQRGSTLTQEEEQDGIATSEGLLSLTSETISGGRSDGFGCPAGMPAPQELDLNRDLSDGLALGATHHNSPAFATRCVVESKW